MYIKVKEMDPRITEINKLALLCIRDKKLLVARSKGNDTFYIPGGKREPGENDQQALIREIKEELLVDILPESIDYVETFRAQAHGKPAGVQVKMTCYQAEFSQAVKPTSEIEEVLWIHYDDNVKCSAVTRIIMVWLKQQALIDSKSLVNTNEIPMNYDWILFDADDTLFHFDALSGLKHMFATYNIDFTKKDYDEYQVKNKALWVEYQNGIITAKELQTQRFGAWAEKLKTSSQILNSAFLTAMAKICTTLDGAVELLNSLRGNYKLGIITNGFTELQRVRLESTGLKDHFDLLVVSEEVNYAKPHRGIFDHALNLMGNPARERVLMVGDTLESDIQGGINAGMDTCWLNTKNIVAGSIKPTHQVTSLAELQQIFKAKNKCFHQHPLTAFNLHPLV
jgi:5'-nucleotidase